MLSQLERARKAVGARQTIRALKAGTVVRVFLARDADPDVVAPIEAFSGERQIEVEWADTMKQLGQACGIAVGTAVAALLA